MNASPLVRPQVWIGWLIGLIIAKLMLPAPFAHAQIIDREAITLPSAEGSGVGNGTGADVDELTQQFLTRLNSGAAFLPRDLAEATGWCNRAASILNEGLVYAISLENQGRQADAETLLRRTLEIARNSLAVNAVAGPITHRLLSRGANTLLAMDRAAPPIPIHARLNFLKNYFAFVVRVAQELDLGWYLGSRYGESVPHFDSLFMAFVRQQFEQILRFGYQSTGRGWVAAGPAGTDRATVILAEYLVLGAAHDLAGGLASYALANPGTPAGRCSYLVEQMRSFHERLAQFNSGSRLLYPSFPAATLNIQSQLNRWLSDLNTCH